MRRRLCRAIALLSVGVTVLAACGLRQQNFSQYPGFDAWYRANPPAERIALPDEQALLNKYRPRLFVARHSGQPIRFYEDYIAHGNLQAVDGTLISEQVDAALLNRHKHNPAVEFVHLPAERATRPQAIARVDYASLPANGAIAAQPLIFLTYHFVFAHSGIAAGVRGWQQWLVSVLASRTDWHQLDHYTAVSIVLSAVTLKPVAAMFQQHNYLRTWLLADQSNIQSLALPPDNRLPVVAAIDSNELYSYRSGRQMRRALPSMKAAGLDWLIHARDRPMITADDVTNPQIEVDYGLRFLPPSDAFYVFRGWLGERRRTPGRDGPPGADFNTIPALKDRAAQLAVSFWHEGDQQYIDLYQQAFGRADGAVSLSGFYRRLSAAIAPAVTVGTSMESAAR